MSIFLNVFGHMCNHDYSSTCLLTSKLLSITSDSFALYIPFYNQCQWSYILTTYRYLFMRVKTQESIYDMSHRKVGYA